MKKVIYLAFFLLLPLLIPQKISAQSASIDLVVFTPLPEINFGAFALADIPSGYSRIFTVNITPAGERVIVAGSISWKKDRNSGYEQLYSFETYPFAARNFSNSDIGRGDLRIRTSNQGRSSLLEEMMEKGKPTGSYTISLTLKSDNGQVLDTDTEVLQFTNPTQTITIRTPEANSTQDIGSAILGWDGVVGASSYEVLANVRTREGQSLEDALNRGTPIIDNVDVGNTTVANLRTLFTREPLPGQEIVVQVIAVVPSPGGEERLESNIINFFLSSSSSPEEEALRTRMVSTLSTILGSGNNEFLEMIRNGEIDLSTLRITDESGRRITIEELQQLFNYLQTNPDALIGIQFNAN